MLQQTLNLITYALPGSSVISNGRRRREVEREGTRKPKLSVFYCPSSLLQSKHNKQFSRLEAPFVYLVLWWSPDSAPTLWCLLGSVSCS